MLQQKNEKQNLDFRRDRNDYAVIPGVCHESRQEDDSTCNA